MTISNTTAFSNGVNGFALAPMGSLSVTNVSAVQNGADGVLFTPFFDPTVAAAQEMDSTMFPLPPIQILDSLIISNSVDGVSFGADFCRIDPSFECLRRPSCSASPFGQQRPCQRRPCPMSTATSSAPMGSLACMPPNPSARAMTPWATGGARLADRSINEERHGNRLPGARRHEWRRLRRS